MADDLAKSMMAFFDAVGMKEAFAKQMDLPLATNLPLLIRQSQLMGAGAQTLALAITEHVAAQRDPIDRLLTIFSLPTATAYADAEAAILGLPAVMRAALFTGQDPSELAKLVARFGGLDEGMAGRTLAQIGSITFSDTKVSEPDHLIEVIQAFAEVRCRLTLALADPLSPDAMQARRDLVATGAVGPLAGAMLRVKTVNRAKILAVALKAFQSLRQTPADLGGNLIRLASQVR